LDVHFGKSQMCVLDAHGKVLREQMVSGPWSEVAAHLGRLKGPFQVCYEASIGYGHIHELIKKLPQSQRIVVAHPGQVRLIFKAKKKNDRVDAKKLATLLYLDQVPQVHVPGQEVRSWRAMIEWRQKLLMRRVMAKNQIRSLLKSCGIVPLKGKKLWSRAGMKWFKEQTWPTAFEALRRDMLIEDLKDLDLRMKRVEEALEQIAARHPGMSLLMTIPGVGVRTAETFLAYVDDPQRFGRVGSVGVYFGLVPCQDASAAKNRLGHITKEGPPTARKLLVEAAWQGIMRSPRIKQHFEQISQGKPDRRKIALVATARWLSTVMLSMLKSGECWRPESDAK
jgi:transposase